MVMKRWQTSQVKLLESKQLPLLKQGQEDKKISNMCTLHAGHPLLLEREKEGPPGNLKSFGGQICTPQRHVEK